MHSRHIFLSVILVFVLVNAFHINIYFPPLHLNEMALFLTVILYFTCAARIEFPKDKYFRYVILTPLLILIFIFFYALIFSRNTGSSFLASVLAQRNFLYFLLIPCIVTGRFAGFTESFIEKIVFYSMAAVTVTYFSMYIMLHIPQTLPIIKSYLINIIGVDQDRGVRIKGPMFIILLSLYYYPGLLKKTLNYRNFFLIWVLIICDIAVIIFHQPRTLLLGSLISFLIVSVSRLRLTLIKKLVLIVVPVMIAGIFIGHNILRDIGNRFEGNFSLSSRIFSAGIALSSVRDHPLFGLGYASHQSVAYQELFGESFFPDDIGLIGIFFQFGIFGGILYLYLLYWMIKNTLINLKNRNGRRLWSKELSDLLVFSSLTMIIILPTIAKAIRTDGIGMTALILGILLSNKIAPRSAER